MESDADGRKETARGGRRPTGGSCQREREGEKGKEQRRGAAGPGGVRSWAGLWKKGKGADGPPGAEAADAALLCFAREEEEMGRAGKQGRTGQMPGKEREGKRNSFLFS